MATTTWKPSRNGASLQLTSVNERRVVCGSGGACRGKETRRASARRRMDGLLPEPAHDDRGIVAAEAERVGHRVLDRQRPLHVGDVVEVALGVGRLVVDRRV